MRGRFACLLLLGSLSKAAPVTPTAILDRALKSVAAQLARAGNYECVQTIDRQYLVSRTRQLLGCAAESSSESVWMRDRLRLDIAVSESREIYSWHGAEKFTSSDVSEVVETNPISSGNFIGFLQNIFLDRGTQFTYAGESDQHGLPVYKFNYVVLLGNSAYHLQLGPGSRPAISFHGSFSVEGSGYQLTRLQVVADLVPPQLGICSAVTSITYQMVSISGQPSLIPASFVLETKDERHDHTVSTSQYSQCREFRGESTLRFEPAGARGPSPSTHSQVATWLPAGVSLHIGLRTPIDDRTAYVGDPIRGVLLDNVEVPGTRTTVPKGAIVEGILSKLEEHYIPASFQLVSVNFNRLTFGNTVILLNATPETSLKSWRMLGLIYGLPLPASIAEEDRKGVLVIRSPHVHLDHQFSGKWITGIPRSASLESSVQ